MGVEALSVIARAVAALVDVEAAVGAVEAGVAVAAVGDAGGHALAVVTRVAGAVVHLRAVDA